MEYPKMQSADVPIFPLLKSHDWEAQHLCIFQNFNDLDKPPVPLIAFCQDTEDGYTMITRQAAEKNGWTADSLRAQAQENIDAYQAQWEDFGESMLTASGSDFSSEKMLSKPFLLDAQQQLGAERILVAAPRRTVLYAANDDMDEDAMEMFKMIIAKTLSDDSYGHQRISPLIFRFENAEVVGALIAEDVDD
jgi:uncharacterized protein YtpQ (UPF0354 family)